MNGDVIKRPDEMILVNTIRVLEIDCKTDFEQMVAEYGKDSYWIDLENKGYRCVPVEITEIKK